MIGGEEEEEEEEANAETESKLMTNAQFKFLENENPLGKSKINQFSTIFSVFSVESPSRECPLRDRAAIFEYRSDFLSLSIIFIPMMLTVRSGRLLHS